MATKIRGITIELGADASGLEKALKGVNSQISSTQKQLKDVDRLLKLDPKNTELLEQKQRLLADSVSNTRTKLDALKEAQKQVGEELEKTGEGQEQYDALTREIASTELKLKDAEKAANSFNVTNQKIAATAKDLGKKFDNVAKKTKALSAAAGGALLALGGLAVKAANDADDMLALSKQTGIATDELQKMAYAAGSVDVDVDTITGSMKKLKKAVAGHDETWEKIGVSVKKANGEYRDIQDIFYDTLGGLSKITDETERDIVAMDLFGKSADELAGIIDDGGQALKEFGQEAENLDLIIPEEELEKAAELSDELDRMKGQASMAFAEIGVQLAESIMPYLPEIKDAITELLNALKEIDPDTLMIGIKCAAIVAAISPIASVCASVTTAVSTLTSALGGISASAVGLGGLIAVCAAAVLAFGLFGDKIGEVVDEITNGWLAKLATDWEEKFDIIGEVLNSWQADLKMIIDWCKDYFRAWIDFYRGLFTGDWARMWKGAQEIVMNTVDGIIMGAKMMVNTLISVLNGLIDGLNHFKMPDWLGGKQINIPKIAYLAEGGILTSGSAIVGEAGPEFVSVSDGRAMVTPLSGDNDIGALLETYLPYLAAGTQMVMDSGALVGSIAPDMNTALGTIAIRGGRR